jgi:hypothetical protein
MEIGRDNSTVNIASGWDGRSGNQRHNNGNAAILATRVTRFGSE